MNKDRSALKNHSISTRMEKIKQNKTSKQIQLTIPNNSKSVKQLDRTHTLLVGEWDAEMVQTL